MIEQAQASRHLGVFLSIPPAVHTRLTFLTARLSITYLLAVLPEESVVLL